MTLEKLVEAKLVHKHDYVYDGLKRAEQLAKEYREAGTNYLSVYSDGTQALYIEVIESQGFGLKKAESTASSVWMLFERV